MYKRTRRVVALVSVCVFVTGIAAYAQAQAPRQKAADRASVQQKAGQAAPRQVDAQRLRDRVGARMGNSLNSMLMPPSPEWVQKLAVRLGLTDQQKQQIRQLYVSFQSAVKPIRQQKIEATRAFMTAFRNPNVSKAELERLSEPILRADRAILDAEFDFWLGFRAVLNAQQQAQLHSFMMEKAGKQLGDVQRSDRPKGNRALPAK